MVDWFPWGPWTAGPGAQKNFDPEHPLAGDSKGRSLALVLYSIQFVSCPSSLALCTSHSPPIPRVPPCLRARVNVCECRGGKRSVISPRGALNLPAARFLQTKRFDPLLYGELPEAVFRELTHLKNNGDLLGLLARARAHLFEPI